MDLPGLDVVQGEWDLRGRADEYLGHQDFAGKSVLDVGTASGFLTFEMEKRGATVVSVEADTIRRIQLLPLASHSILKDYEAWVPHGEDHLNRQKASYWCAHAALRSSARAYYGDVYNLPDDLGMFDTVVVGQILVHLRDPAGALISIAKRAADTLIIAEGMIESDDQIARYLPVGTDSPASIWWHYSEGLYKEFLRVLGFTVLKRHISSYRCVVANQDIAITTLVCKRT
jgi:hypothetical protein